MAEFIELTSIYNHPILINVESIAFIEPHEEGTMIHLCTTQICSSDRGSSEVVYINDSYQTVKRKIIEA